MRSAFSLLDQTLECGPDFPEQDTAEEYEGCVAPTLPRARRVTTLQDVMDFPSVLRSLQLEFRISDLTRQYKSLQDRIEQLEWAEKSVVVSITTLEPEPFELIRDIPVVVAPSDDGYLATFFDANIGITGDTREESVANLRVLIADMFDDLENHESKLGPHPQRQLAVLRSIMRRRP